MRLLADEGQIGSGKSMQTSRRVIIGRRYRRAGPFCGLRHSGAGRGRQEATPAAEMDVWRRVADSQILAV